MRRESIRISRDLQAVTAADIQRVMKKYFTDTNRLVLYYLPEASKKSGEGQISMTSDLFAPLRLCVLFFFPCVPRVVRKHRKRRHRHRRRRVRAHFRNQSKKHFPTDCA